MVNVWNAFSMSLFVVGYQFGHHIHYIVIQFNFRLEMRIYIIILYHFLTFLKMQFLKELFSALVSMLFVLNFQVILDEYPDNL
jgi:hypothetical protein